jgi:hypothetical protein
MAAGPSNLQCIPPPPLRSSITNPLLPAPLHIPHPHCPQAKPRWLTNRHSPAPAVHALVLPADSDCVLCPAADAVNVLIHQRSNRLGRHTLLCISVTQLPVLATAPGGYYITVWKSSGSSKAGVRQGAAAGSTHSSARGGKACCNAPCCFAVVHSATYCL